MAEVVRSQVGIATYLSVNGPLTEPKAVAALHEALSASLANRERQLVLDFANVPLINSTALEVLLNAQDQLLPMGGEIKLAHANAAIREVLALTEVDQQIGLVQLGAESVPRRRVRSGVDKNKKLGELLVERRLVDDETIDKAVKLQTNTGRRLGRILLEQGWLSEEGLLSVLSEQLSLPFIKPRTGLFDPEVARLINPSVAKRLKVVPLFKVRGALYLATSDAQAIPSFDTVAEITGAKVKPVLAISDDIAKCISEAHSEDHDLAQYMGELDQESDLELIEDKGTDDYATIDEIASGSPVINLINGLVQRAVRDGASDIHLEPSRTRCRVRFRIDGVLYQVMTPPSDIYPALVSRLKVIANLDIAERRLPQDGRIQVVTQGRTIDLRFSSLPGIFGEKVVLRVLDKTHSIMEIDRLGMAESSLEVFKRLLAQSHGLILVTGPTGSGKTTTLYSALHHLNSIEKSLVTIEDPVEYQIDSINQNQVREQVGLSFAKVLKHVLRQDPDIVMVGEIRERETAEIAVQAALTGHLVLSTLHTNDSVGAITRMLDMGVEPFLLSSALIGVMAQRLIRTVCQNCKTSYVAIPESLIHLGIKVDENVRLNRGKGCPSCYDSGYRGRIAIHEILECDGATQRLMVSSPSRDDLAQHIEERAISTLFDAGIEQALAGKTTVEEVTRVTGI